ncbi:MAG TPA: family 43 glycosylhydrolase [Verrucomicrobiae bacterium]|nr:family 43 glycosylhydrolase [Verrucomicrobiae bacterium]
MAENPDLGKYTSDKQQPVDFAIWQAADGTWQLWSCIRNTKCGGETRLFHRWEGKQLQDRNWKPMGVAMTADTSLGESEGGLQAPYVFKENDRYYMFYGDLHRICLATSSDGKEFTRHRNRRGQPDLFSGPYEWIRDPMVMKWQGLYFCYYMAYQKDAKHRSAIFCRTSHDLEHWSEPIMVAAGGAAASFSEYNTECPFVVQKDNWFYLFSNQIYGRKSHNIQYASPNPLSWGIDDDRWKVSSLQVAAPEIIFHNGEWYIASCNLALDGIRIARLEWIKN